MKALIERLVAAGHAYVAEDHVLFGVPSMPDYGKLAQALARRDDRRRARRRRALQARPDGLRAVEAVEARRAGLAVARAASRRRAGRAGTSNARRWSWKHLGETFDIHGGGIDLVFPHHENEIAQTRCAFHARVMANFWMHNGFLQVEGEKMSKSLGNFVTIRELLADWPGEVLRFNMLRTHYRQPIDWTVEGPGGELRRRSTTGTRSRPMSPRRARSRGAVLEALADDLNTPQAICGACMRCGRRQGGDQAGAGELVASRGCSAPERSAAGLRGAAVGSMSTRQGRGSDRRPHGRAQGEELRREPTASATSSPPWASCSRTSKDGTTWEIAR